MRTSPVRFFAALIACSSLATPMFPLGATPPMTSAPGAMAAATVSASTLPFSTVFKGKAKFDQLVARAKAENWVALPIGDRVAKVGEALIGTPYKNYTLEIDDHIEAVSANLDALDCWTFFEVSLGFARMLKARQGQEMRPQDLLDQIEKDRYRDGICTGGYLSRLHYLEEWLQNNAKRNLITNPTESLGGVRISSKAREMTAAWKSYRYLRNNPELRPGMRILEDKISAIPTYHIPKGKIAAIEKNLKNGDIVCISTKEGGGIFFHVGMIYKGADGVAHFLHASYTYKKVTLDKSISQYCSGKRRAAGITVARPLE